MELLLLPAMHELTGAEEMGDMFRDDTSISAMLSIPRRVADAAQRWRSTIVCAACCWPRASPACSARCRRQRAVTLVMLAGGTVPGATRVQDNIRAVGAAVGPAAARRRARRRPPHRHWRCLQQCHSCSQLYCWQILAPAREPLGRACAAALARLCFNIVVQLSLRDKCGPARDAWR